MSIKPVYFLTNTIVVAVKASKMRMTLMYWQGILRCVYFCIVNCFY